MTETPAPPGATDSTTLPLAGLRVIDFSWIVAGPSATRILADFGAEVIRIEHGQSLDSIRLAPPHVGGGPTGNNSGTFNYFNRNKKSMLLSVRHPMGMDVLRRLIEKSDIVVENFSSRVLENWGLGYPELKAINQRIIYCCISGFGHTGRDRDHSTWGPTAQAMSGLTFMSGRPGLPSSGWGFSYLDHTAGYYGAIGILAALRHRNKTGEGQMVDISQIETGMALAGPPIVDFTVNGRKNRDHLPVTNRAAMSNATPHNTYPCAGEDRWVAITVMNNNQWRALVCALGDPEWARNEAYATVAGRFAASDTIDAHIAEWTREREDYAVMEELQAAGVPCGVCQKPGDKAGRDPQLRARGWWKEVEQTEIGRGTIDGFTPLLSASPGAARVGAPNLGEHTHDIMREVLGMTDEEIIDHEEAGVFM